jgi:hypothetical protein
LLRKHPESVPNDEALTPEELENEQRPWSFDRLLMRRTMEATMFIMKKQGYEQSRRDSPDDDALWEPFDRADYEHSLDLLHAMLEMRARIMNATGEQSLEGSPNRS